MGKNKNTSEIITKLKNASDGLLWMSESEYPFEIIMWEDTTDLTADKLLQQVERYPSKGSAKPSPDTPVRVTDIDKFFSNAIAEHDWYGEEQKAEVQKCRKLMEELKANLSDIKVYCVGEVEIDIYVVGKTPDGNLAGVSTMVVET